MPFFILYLVKFSISVSIVYVFYQLLLRKITFYNWNRWYLLGYSLLCLFIPFIHINPLAEEHNFSNAQVFRYIPAIEDYTTTPVHIGGNVPATVRGINSWPILYSLLLIGALIMTARLIIQFISLQRIKRKASIISDGDTIIYHVDKKIIPFSFGNAIYLNRDLHSEKELQAIILHEYVHIKQNHTADIFFAEFLCIVNWYNPFAWLMRHAIRQNLEFIADNHLLQNGLDKKSYQYHLLNVVGSTQYRIANSFNFSSLKKRIAMMNKIKSAKVHLLRFLFMLPLIALLLLAFRDKYKRIFKNQTVINEVGIIVDINSKQPIAGVSVSDTISGVKTISDERGFYAMKIPIITKNDFFTVALKFTKEGYENNSSSGMYSFSKMQSHGHINIDALIPLSGTKSISFFGLNPFNNKFPDDPTYEDALQQFRKAKREGEDWDLYFKLQKDHPEVSLFYTSEYKKKIIVFYQDGLIEKYGFPGGATMADMQKKFGQLPDMMTKSELPLPAAYLAKWESIAAEAEKKFHTDNPNVYAIIFPGDSRVIAVPKKGKPQIYDLDNAVPEERPAFEKLYGSLDGIVPPAANFVNAAHNDERYKDWRISGIEFVGFNKVDYDKDNSATHFTGEGVLKINNAAQALIIYHNKEYNPESFKNQFGNGKVSDVFVYENEGAFNKFGQKGRYGVIVINDNSSASTSSAHIISVIKKDSVPSTSSHKHFGISLHRDDRMNQEDRNFFNRNAGIHLLHWTADDNQLQIYHVKDDIENVNLKNNGEVRNAIAKYKSLPQVRESYFDRKPLLDSVLIMVDNKEINSLQMERLDVKEIESISIVKDSSAINQYGNRAKKGVIIITTKKALEKNKRVKNKKNADFSFASNDGSEIKIKISVINLFLEYLNGPQNDYRLVPTNIGFETSELSKLIDDYNKLQRKRETQLHIANENDIAIKEIDYRLKADRDKINNLLGEVKHDLELKMNRG